MGSFALVLSTLLAAAPGAAPSPPPDPSPAPTGEEIIRRMHDRYAGKWYRTLTFTQRTTMPDGHVETWYEAMTLPGKLRIDIAPLDSMKALIFRSDSIYQFSGGKLAHAGPQVHPLMVLGFDVYGVPATETVRKLRELKFDLSKVHETTWQGRKTYVVGAAPGDTTSAQFWIDKERLYFVRSLEPSKKDPSVINEVQFNDYRKVGGGWVGAEVLFFSGGEKKVTEEYSDIRGDVPVDQAIFDPSSYRAPGWVQ